MEVYSPTDLKPIDPPSFLLQGPPGGGKTTLALEFPGVWVADCDINTNGPLRYLQSENRLGRFYYDSIFFDDDKNKLDYPEAWDRLMLKSKEAIADPDVKAVFYDSLTAINDMLIRWVMKKQRLMDSATMEIQHWIPFRNQLMLLINQARTAGKVVIMSAHQYDQLDKKGVCEKHCIAVSTKLTHYFAAFFTDSWRLYSRPGAKGQTKFFVQTKSTGLDELKNSFGMPAEFELTGGYQQLNTWMHLP